MGRKKSRYTGIEKEQVYTIQGQENEEVYRKGKEQVNMDWEKNWIGLIARQPKYKKTLKYLFVNCLLDFF